MSLIRTPAERDAMARELGYADRAALVDASNEVLSRLLGDELKALANEPGNEQEPATRPPPPRMPTFERRIHVQIVRLEAGRRTTVAPAKRRVA